METVASALESEKGVGAIFSISKPVPRFCAKRLVLKNKRDIRKKSWVLIDSSVKKKRAYLKFGMVPSQKHNRWKGKIRQKEDERKIRCLEPSYWDLTYRVVASRHAV